MTPALRHALPLAAALAFTAGAGRAQVVIRPNTPMEKQYLVEDKGALREIGYDPLCRFTRIADGPDMFYTYRFAPGKGRAAYLLVSVGTQFLISASGDGGQVYTPVADIDQAERVGTRVLVDLSPFVRQSGVALVRFKDKYPADGWGALTSEILYYEGGAGPARLVPAAPLRDMRTRDGRRVSRFATRFTAPAGWAGRETALYVGCPPQAPVSVRLNGHPLDIGPTWDNAQWALLGNRLRGGEANTLEVDLQPGSKLDGPVRVGLRIPACAAPRTRLVGGRQVAQNRLFAPYTPEKMNYLAGNFMQMLFDSRTNLLCFMPGERQPIHFVHDTLRSLSALAEEDRYTPVVRLELARRLWQGCRKAILPGGEFLFAFKHDRRPVDIRPLPNSTDLTLAHKLDEVRFTAAIGPEIGDPAAKPTVVDTPAVQSGGYTRFTRTWTLQGRSVACAAAYPPGDADRPPTLEFQLDGKGPVAIHIGRLDQPGMWFTPGSWGPEAVVLPNGRETWCHESGLEIDHPAIPYILIRGGNSGQYTFCRSLLIQWSSAPGRISARKVAGGRHGMVWSDIVLEYPNSAPSRVRLVVFPFDGHPEGLKTPRTLADNLVRTGRFGCGIFDPVATATGNALGPEAMAAAALLFRKYHAPEAREAEKLAVQVMSAFTALDRAGTHSEQLYYLPNACRNMAEAGHPEYRPWAKTWSDRMLDLQSADGTYPWCNYQLRMMIALLKAHEFTRDNRYLAAFNRALPSIRYVDNQLYWRDRLEQLDDFAGAGPFAIFGHLGRADTAQSALASRLPYIDDRGFMACSDLNPYMLGFSAAGLGLRKAPKLVLELTGFARYDRSTVKRLPAPTATVVNPFHPVNRGIRFALPGMDVPR